MNAGQNAAMTELVVFGRETAAQNQAFGFELGQRDVDGFLRQRESRRQRRGRDGADRIHPSS